MSTIIINKAEQLHRDPEDNPLPGISKKDLNITITPEERKQRRRKKIQPAGLVPPSRKGPPRMPQRNIPSERELFTNPHAYCEELLNVRDKTGNIVPFRWNDVQLKLHATIQRAKADGFRYFMILKYRRAGITTYFQSRSFFKAANREGHYCVTIAHDSVSTAKIFEIASLFYDSLPDWARPKRKTENKRELNFPGLKSQFYIGTAGNEDFGRGMTLQSVHASEVAFFPKSTNVANLMGGLQEATSHGELFLETTANGVGNWYHKAWVAAKNKENKFFPIFLSWKDDVELRLPTRKTLEELHLDEEEINLVKVYQLEPAQILWRRMKMKELYSPDLGNLMFKQEYPINDIEAFIATGNTFFDAEICAKLVDLCSPPIQEQDRGRMKIFHPPATYATYVIGADIGEGVPGGNKSSLSVLDTRTCEEVACWTGITSPEDFARKLADIGYIYNSALVAPEANNFGHSTINTLLNELNYPHIFQHQDYQRINVDGTELVPKYGWQTNQRTRPLMLSEFRFALQGGLMKINDRDLFQECLSFIDTGHGKYEAASGADDDRIFAKAIAWQARSKATEMISLDQYAIDTGFRSISNDLADL
jgi:hypothetical protein